MTHCRMSRSSASEAVHKDLPDPAAPAIGSTDFR